MPRSIRITLRIILALLALPALFVIYACTLALADGGFGLAAPVTGIVIFAGWLAMICVGWHATRRK